MPMLIPKETLERKLRFLQQHPLRELDQAKLDLDRAQEQWNDYQEDHRKRAKLAKSINVFRNDQYNSTQTAFENAASRYAKLKAEFDAQGIQEDDSPEHIAAILEAAQKKDSPIDFSKFCYENLKDLSFSDRSALFSANLSRIYNLKPEDTQREKLVKTLHATYESIEKKLFLEKEIACLDTSQLRIPALESLTKEKTRLTSLISQRYNSKEALCAELNQQVNLAAQRSEIRLLRALELAPTYNRMRLELSFYELVRLSPQERAAKIAAFSEEFGPDYADARSEITRHCNETVQKITLSTQLEQQLLFDWNEEILKHESEEAIESRLHGKLESISKIDDEHRDIKKHLSSKAHEIGQRVILYHRIQKFPVHLWSLETQSDRLKYYQEFESQLPIMPGRNEISREVETVYKNTEAKIQIDKMEGALEALGTVSLNVHVESQTDVPFQEAEIDFDKLRLANRKSREKHAGTQTEEATLRLTRQKLRQRHELILKENRLIRSAVENLDAFRQLSFEAQERAIPWIADKWFCNLRIQDLFAMMGVEPVLPSQEGLFHVGSLSYQLSPFQIVFLKSYVEEALKKFKETSREHNWLSYQILRELGSVQQQISDCVSC